VGRLKGEAYMLAGLDESALNTLTLPYRRGERDPRLLAALGIYEKTLDHPDRARTFLEAATAKKVVRPRAYLELARLRFMAARAQPTGEAGTFSDEQAVSILSLLRAARLQPPSMPEVYELMSDTLAQTKAAPERDYLVLLNEGVQRYPTRLGLIYQAATLFFKAGDITSASALVEHGLHYAATTEARTRFNELKAKLSHAASISGTPSVPP